MSQEQLRVRYVPINELKSACYNPRKWSERAIADLTESIKRYGMVDPLLVNNAENRKNIVIGGHFRLKVAKDLGYTEVPVVYVNIPDIEKEKELNIRLNKNLGEFDWDLLAKFDENFLSTIGFSSEELDEVFDIDDNIEQFDLEKELKKLEIGKIEMQTGEIWQLGENRLMIGNSMEEADVLKLMDGEKADLCLTDPPYLLNYLLAKRHGKPTDGFGAKKNRRYIGTDELPEDFSERWMSNVAKVQKPNFSIIVYENWKNLKTIWSEMEKHWKIQNMLIWHLPNRMQGFSAKHKFFNKYDFALAGTSGDILLNTNPEEELLQNEYESAIFAISGDPTWEGYSKGKKYCPTDFIEFNAGDEKNSGQGIVFGTKPIEILLPYLKVLTKRDDIIIEPFGGSGSTLIAATKMKRRCYLMEKCPIYAEVIRNRWEKLTGQKARRIDEKK